MKKSLILTGMFIAGISLSIQAKSIISEAQAYKSVEASIYKNKLTGLKPNCIKYAVAEDAQQYQFDFYEVHNKQCGGDPDIERRMFSYLVSKKDGKLQTDAVRDDVDWDGAYHPIK
ncbi:hypothetical protein [Pasteurella testudinis]|uniref:hypothetical protein n=1 Tax=Pasteurella testudinis TaxID=761 RepID=UPI004059B48C